MMIHGSHLEQAILSMCEAFSQSLIPHDISQIFHGESVAMYSDPLGQALGLTAIEQRDLRLAGRVHDIGKMCVIDLIVAHRYESLPRDHPDLLAMRAHVTFGAQILRRFAARYTSTEDICSCAALIHGALYHHEDWDGRGYAGGLRGDAIPRIARIIRVVDSYCAMTCPDRAWRTALNPQKALQELEDGMGKQYDPKIVPIFIELMNLGYLPGHN